MVQVNSFCVSSATEILFIEAMPRSSAWKHINCVAGWRSKTENWAARDDLLEGGYCLLRFLGTKQIRTIEIRIRLAGADMRRYEAGMFVLGRTHECHIIVF